MPASDKTGMNRYPLSKLVYMYTNAGTLARGLIMVYTTFLCYRPAPMLLAKCACQLLIDFNKHIHARALYNFFTI